VSELVLRRPRRDAAGAPNRMRLPALGFVVVYAALLLLVPSRLVVGPLGSAGTLASVAGTGALVWWLFATVSGQNPVRGFTPTRVAVTVLAAAVLAAYGNGNLNGWYAPPSIRQSTDDLYDLVLPNVGDVTGAMITSADRGLIAFAGWMGILLLTAEGLRSARDLELLVDWLCGIGFVFAGVGIVEFFVGVNLAAYVTIPGLSSNAPLGTVLSRSVLNRPSGTAIHPIEFGVVVAGLFPLALHRCIHRWGGKLVLLPVAAVAVALFMSVSRSAVLGLIVSGTVLFLGWPDRWRLRALWIAPVSLVALRLAVPGLVGTIISLFRNAGSDPSVTGRTDDYDVVFKLYHEHELFGRGLFTFVPRYYRILDNQYLMFLLELGLVGLASALLLLGTGFFSARTAHRRAPSFRSRHLGLALSGSILGLVVVFATFDALSFPMAAGLTFLLVGMASAARRFALEDAAEAAA
jgi:polysaccharide biosynthesis protein PslJ